MATESTTELRIGEVAEQSGLATSAIRYYEDQGLLPKPHRRGGQRMYGPQVIDQLALIDLGEEHALAQLQPAVLGQWAGRRSLQRLN